ncbi:hypothetical protein [Nocardia macrotermitis]|uniref:Uncharacterized protein n=1 Tax=Nocardia macrotermitis TaxID=2585198 RepID=A0A7K0CVC2_9NOCA|nr:hypothetical protein [Nocardia macrotermitis]MQY17460.1 hypothetical protein [Nocardia macrotermitis]
MVEILPPTDHAPLAVMSIELAHRIMQWHIDCPVTICAVKRQAKTRLIQAQRLVPADQPHFGI